MRFAALIIALLLAVDASAQEKLHVVASFSILGDMVKQVAGDAVELKTLVGPDADAHAYTPSPTDARTVAQADLVIINGLGLEGWLERLATGAGNKAHITIASQGITALPMDDSPASLDPHAWQSLHNARIYIANIRDALALANPAQAALYRANAQRYLQELDILDAQVKTIITSVSLQQRKVISTHDAFRYFGKEYGVTFLAPLGVSTESQASAAGMAALIDQVRALQIKAIFLENMTDSRLIRQLEKDAGAHVGGMLYSDSLSMPEGPAATFIALFRHNAEALTEGMRHNPM